MAKAEHVETPRRSERLRKLREAKADASSSPASRSKPTPKASTSKSPTKPTPKASTSKSPAQKLRRKASTSNEESPRKKARTSPAKGRVRLPKTSAAPDVTSVKAGEPSTQTPVNRNDQPLLSKKKQPIDRKERLQAIHKAISQLSVDEELLSNPKNYLWLPYPSLRFPRNDKFTLQNSDDIFVFPFMGRKHFADLHGYYQKHVRGEDCARRLVLQGANGSGRASCLAALACLLTRLGRHVIFIANCYDLAIAFVQIMKNALYFAIPSDLHSAIDAAKTADDLVELVGDFPKDHFVFILPDWDVFYPRENDVDASAKAASWSHLSRMMLDHYSICSISHDAENLRDLKLYEDSSDIFTTLGGFTDDEMNCWWNHYSEKLPSDIQADDRTNIEFITGRLPYFLKGLLKLSGRQYQVIKKEFLTNEVLSSLRISINHRMYKRLRAFSKDANKLELFFEYMKACIQETTLTSTTGLQSEILDPEILDPEFFYFVDNIGKCLTSDVREIAMKVILERTPTFLDDRSWTELAMNAPDPLMRRFFLKQLCLVHISSQGLTSVDKRLTPMPLMYFDKLPYWSSAFTQKGPEMRHLFIPTQVSDVLVDGIILFMDTERNFLELFAIQVASSSEIPCIDEYFFLNDWRKLTESIVSDGYAQHVAIRANFIFFRCGRTFEGLDGVQKKVVGHEWELDYKYYNISLPLFSDAI